MCIRDSYTAVAKAIVPTSGRNPEEIVEDVLDTVPGAVGDTVPGTVDR